MFVRMSEIGFKMQGPPAGSLPFFVIFLEYFQVGLS